MIVNNIQELFKALLLVLRMDFISDLLTFMWSNIPEPFSVDILIFFLPFISSDARYFWIYFLIFFFQILTTSFNLSFFRYPLLFFSFVMQKNQQFNHIQLSKILYWKSEKRDHHHVTYSFSKIFLTVEIKILE